MPPNYGWDSSTAGLQVGSPLGLQPLGFVYRVSLCKECAHDAYTAVELVAVGIVTSALDMLYPQLRQQRLQC